MFLTDSDRRTRVSLRFDSDRGAVVASVRIAVERRWDMDDKALKIPSSLKKAGGRSGLDAAFVARVIGEKCFAESKIAETETRAAAEKSTLMLPGNVSVQMRRDGSLAVCVGELSVERRFSGSSVVAVAARNG
jgi:hypothetical protein